MTTPDPTLVALLGRLTLTNGQLAQLNGNLQEVLIAMSTITELKTAADALVTADAVLATEVGSLTTAVEGLVTVVGTLRAGGALSAADQASLDAAVQEVTDSSTGLATETASLSTEQAHAQTAATPPPAPGP
jgi:peptidoglycan hydrolase CwlO-like protein